MQLNTAFVIVALVVVAAARVYDAMDMTVNPCDDFFQYACGNWVKKNPIPDDKSSISQFALLGDEMDIKLKGLYY